MNQEISETKQEKIILNDIGFRLILIPAFGILIPLLTDLISYDSFSLTKTKLAFLYSILISFVIWQGNRFLLFTLRSYFNWFEKPLKKVFALILTVPFYTLPVSFIMLFAYYGIFEGGRVDWNKVNMTSLIILIAVLFIVHVYETAFTVKEAESEKIKRAQTEKVKAEAELEALKNQIDPHFIFNSLNTLSHLIEANPAKAKLFNDALADVYRYILQNKARDMVFLRDEVNFLNAYFSLIKIRFENAVKLVSDIPEEALDRYLIPPISLQTMVENAIKHNVFNDKKPIQLHIRFTGEEIIAANNRKEKKTGIPTSKTGLKNLNDRYLLITGKMIKITEDKDWFSVSLPLVSFN